MGMTRAQMELAVCEKFPKLVEVYYHVATPKEPTYFWRDDEHSNTLVRWPTEGVQLCATVSRHKSIQTVEVYINRQGTWTVHVRTKKRAATVQSADLLTAWLEALCRVWWPSRF